MIKKDKIQKILKDSKYHLSLFTEDEINELRDKITKICLKNKIRVQGKAWNSEKAESR